MTDGSLRRHDHQSWILNIRKPRICHRERGEDACLGTGVFIDHATTTWRVCLFNKNRISEGEYESEPQVNEFLWKKLHNALVGQRNLGNLVKVSEE